VIQVLRGDAARRPTDPPTLFAVAALLIGVALLACWAPAYRAMRIAPLEALRIE
jgi:putative ABC transport system permease protein